MKPNIELTENRVLIKKIEEKPTGGIEIPAGASTTETHHQGEVVCVGADCKKIKKGDKVVFKDGYNKLTLEGEEYNVLREDSVVGVIKDHAA